MKDDTLIENIKQFDDVIVDELETASDNKHKTVIIEQLQFICNICDKKFH